MFQLQLFLGLHEFVVFVMCHQHVSIRACLCARFNMHRFTDGCGPSTNSGQITQASDASQCIANSVRQLKVLCVTDQHLPHDTDHQAVDASEAPACLRGIRARLPLCFLVCSGARAGLAVAPAGATGCSCVATTVVPQAIPRLLGIVRILGLTQHATTPAPIGSDLKRKKFEFVRFEQGKGAGGGERRGCWCKIYG